MDAEQTREVVDLAPETPEQLDTGIETVPVSKSEIEEKVVESEKLTELEKSPEKKADGSPEKASDPVTECHNQPGDIQDPDLEQQPMVEKTPEPLPLDEPLAASHTEGVPEQFAELASAPVQRSEPTLPESVTQPPFEEVKQLCPAKEVPEQPENLADIQLVMKGRPKMQSEPETVKEVVEEAVKVEPENPEKTLKEVEAEKPTHVEEIATEKPAEAQAVEEVVTEKLVAAENLAEAQAVEEVVTEKLVAAENLAEAQAVEEVVTEKLVAAENLAEAQAVEEVVTEKLVAAEKLAEAQAVEEVATEKPTEAQAVEEVVTEKPAEDQAVEEVVTEKSVAPEKPVETQTVDEVVIEKLAVVTAMEPAPEKPSEPCEAVKEAWGGKPVEAETVKDEEKAVVMESTAECVVEKVEQQMVEQQEAELVKEEEPVPAPGSLSFALLEQEQTMAILRTSRTFIILKGLPGSGKSLLARAISENYKDLCTVFCADDHSVKPESPETSTDAYKALDEAVLACCSAGTAASMVVIDDTNHTPGRLARLGELAEQHRLVAMFLEPRTEWRRDLSELVKRSQRGLEEAKIKAMMEPLEETTLPLFFGWFLLHGVQDKVRCMSMDFMKTLDTLEAFQKHLTDFTGEAGKEVDLEQYFQTQGDLHCTTKFCDYGKADGAKEYAEIPAVKELYGSAFELSLSAFFVTPRTVGARVSLSEDQLVLWPADQEKDAEADVPSAASLPPGSRAHITLGCAEGVQPVQTGLDLLEILVLQKEGQQGELVEEMELGSLAYYGKGRWLLSLREPVSAQACFSSRYHPKKEEPAKKESEKKKKQKCTIL